MLTCIFKHGWPNIPSTFSLTQTNKCLNKNVKTLWHRLLLFPEPSISASLLGSTYRLNSSSPWIRLLICALARYIWIVWGWGRHLGCCKCGLFRWDRSGFWSLWCVPGDPRRLNLAKIRYAWETSRRWNGDSERDFGFDLNLWRYYGHHWCDRRSVLVWFGEREGNGRW